MGRSLSAEDVDVLFDAAEGAVRAGFAGRRWPRVALRRLPGSLRAGGGAFVTLHVAGGLNGCIGTLGDEEPLGVAVPRLAWQAAFADPRLPVLRPEDWAALDLTISLLDRPEPMAAWSETDVVEGVRPGVDGLILAVGPYQATFLPAVWDELPDPSDFVRRLHAKMGLPAGWWPVGMQAWRYTVDTHRRPARRSGAPEDAPLVN